MYLGIQLVDQVYSGFDLAGKDGVSNLHPLLDEPLLFRRLDVGFSGESTRGSWVAFVNQIVHNQMVDVPELLLSQSPRQERRICVAKQEVRRTSLIRFSSKISERFPT